MTSERTSDDLQPFLTSPRARYKLPKVTWSLSLEFSRLNIGRKVLPSIAGELCRWCAGWYELIKAAGREIPVASRRPKQVVPE